MLPIVRSNQFTEFKRCINSIKSTVESRYPVQYGIASCRISDLYTRYAVVSELLRSGYHVEIEGETVHFSWDWVAVP